MSDELKPCPFCGEWAMYCDKDGMYADGLETEQATCYDSSCLKEPFCLPVEKWNTRPIEDALQARIAALEAALDAANKDANALFRWAVIASHGFECATNKGGFLCTCGLQDDLFAHDRRHVS